MLLYGGVCAVTFVRVRRITFIRETFNVIRVRRITFIRWRVCGDVYAVAFMRRITGVKR